MTHQQFTIREIEPRDNSKIAQTIREVLIEYGVPKVGTAYADITLDTLSEVYNEDRTIYYVIEYQNKIYGGAGIKQLDHFQGEVCELQKMYFKSEARGIGLGDKMMKICLKKAMEFGFESCYLETMPFMNEARILYRKVGFKNLESRMGDTGHYSCNLWMLKNLT